MRFGTNMGPKWDQKGGQEASKTMSKSYKKQDAFSEGRLGKIPVSPAAMGVVSGGGEA